MIYAIHRYPVHLIDVMMLGDIRVTVRPTLPQDIELQKAFFRSLSRRSRYNRFLTPISEMPAALVESFTDTDYNRHLALLAVTLEEGRERMIGEARYVVDPLDRAACEFAISVADSWQRLGLGGLLLDRLERQATACGRNHMTAGTLSSNLAMLALAARKGYSTSVDPEDASLVHLDKTITKLMAA